MTDPHLLPNACSKRTSSSTKSQDALNPGQSLSGQNNVVYACGGGIPLIAVLLKRRGALFVPEIMRLPCIKWQFNLIQTLLMLNVLTVMVSTGL